MDGATEYSLRAVHARLKACRRCATVCGAAVHGGAFATPVMLVGQAPGPHEESRGRPFAHTAGKTLFQWLNKATGADEQTLRELIYFSAVLRCFPGKHPSGKGDRPPSRTEIENCRPHLADEVAALRPKLIVAVGRTALEEICPGHFGRTTKLEAVVGRKLKSVYHGLPVTVIPLPHPSGLSRWPRVEPGKTLLRKAIHLLGVELRRLDF